MKERIIFHIDVNSAFLSWSAVDMLRNGEKLDIRTIPSIIGGDEENRHGIVLAKSTPAKAFGIVTGEPIISAKRKCRNLKVFKPNFKIYEKCSKAMMEYLKGYSMKMEQFSIDECFLDMTSIIPNEDAIMTAEKIRNGIKDKFGFTVSVGISSNKLLAKMASELRKPDKVNTLYKYEIKEKMWPLKVQDLFMVGKSASTKLNSLYINTIGELAAYDVCILEKKFKTYGRLIYEYANGIDDSKVNPSFNDETKAICASTTLASDVMSLEGAFKVLKDLSENVSARLRKDNLFCSSIQVSIKNSDFKTYSHQMKLINATDSTIHIYESCKKLFLETWHNEPVRLLGIQLTGLTHDKVYQLSIFENKNDEKQKSLDKTLDEIKKKFGDGSVRRGI